MKSATHGTGHVKGEERIGDVEPGATDVDGGSVDIAVLNRLADHDR